MVQEITTQMSLERSKGSAASLKRNHGRSTDKEREQFIKAGGTVQHPELSHWNKTIAHVSLPTLAKDPSLGWIKEYMAELHAKDIANRQTARAKEHTVQGFLRKNFNAKSKDGDSAMTLVLGFGNGDLAATEYNFWTRQQGDMRALTASKNLTQMAFARTNKRFAEEHPGFVVMDAWTNFDESSPHEHARIAFFSETATGKPSASPDNWLRATYAEQIKSGVMADGRPAVNERGKKLGPGQIAMSYLNKEMGDMLIEEYNKVLDEFKVRGDKHPDDPDWQDIKRRDHLKHVQPHTKQRSVPFEDNVARHDEAVALDAQIQAHKAELERLKAEEEEAEEKKKIADDAYQKQVARSLELQEENRQKEEDKAAMLSDVAEVYDHFNDGNVKKTKRALRKFYAGQNANKVTRNMFADMQAERQQQGPQR
jgi:hypothetical protein